MSPVRERVALVAGAGPGIGAARRLALVRSLPPGAVARRIPKGIARDRALPVLPVLARVPWGLSRISRGLLEPPGRRVVSRVHATRGRAG